MALCTKCGAIMHDDDASAHTCRAEDLPVKGIMKVSGILVNNQTKLEVL